jgi:hypothetical protein
MDNLTPQALRNLVHNTQFYSYKGKDYKVIKIVKFKSVVTNVWFDGVEYIPLYEMPKGEWEGSFVRPISDFINLFSPTTQEVLDAKRLCKCTGSFYHDTDCRFHEICY